MRRLGQGHERQASEEALLTAGSEQQPRVERDDALVEREGALAEVRTGWARAAPGHGHCRRICAEGGGGKTAFLRSIMASIRGERVFWGDAEPVSPPEPYLAIARAVPGFDAGGSSTHTAIRALDALRQRTGGTRAVVAMLTQQVRGNAAAASEIDQMVRDSGGNPWFVEALARGDATLSAAHQHLQVRLTRTERDLPGALAVLNAFSVVTRPISFRVVASICGGDSSQLRRLLQALREARILQ